MSEFDTWSAARVAAVTGATGNLALVGYQPVTSTALTAIDGLPASSGRPAAVALADGFDGVVIDAPREAQLAVDGELIAGPTRVARLDAEGRPTLVRAATASTGTVTLDVFSLDGTDIELRRYDTASPRLAAFEAIDTYPYDPAWRLTGHFTPYEQPEPVPWAFTRTIDTGHAKTVPGTIGLTVDGTAHALRAFLDGTQLVLVFADATTGSDTYAPGRFLRIPAPAADGTVTVDFNTAFIPPYGFSDFYSCPLPPPENRIAAAVRAGERAIVWRDDT